MNWGLAEECIPANSFWKRKIFWSGCSTKKSTEVVLRFRAQKTVLRRFSEMFFFQSSLGLILLNWGLVEECIPPRRLKKRRKFWTDCSMKRVLRWLSDSELRKLSWDNLTKSIFQSCLGRNLLNWGLEEECILPSKFWKRMIFLFGLFYEKSLRLLFDIDLKKFSPGNFKRSVFQYCLELILLNWGLLEECIPPSRLRKKKNFWYCFLRKKYLGGCQIPSSKGVLRQFNEKCFSI